MNTGHKQYQPAEKFCACALAADVRFSLIPASVIGATARLDGFAVNDAYI